MTPKDFDNPDWDQGPTPWVHDWRTYISDEMREMWHTFTTVQKRAIASAAQDRADVEDWE